MTETWLHPDVSNGEFLPSTFQVHRYDRPSRGGGVLLALDHTLSSSRIPSPIDLELVSVKLSNPSIIICVVYFRPNSEISYFHHFFQFLSDIVTPGVSIIIMGDFNLPDICWSTLSGDSTISNVFCDHIVDLNSQLVSIPTHSGGNILDLIISNIPHCVTDICPISSSNLNSDHTPISLNLVIPGCKSKKRCVSSWYYNYKKTDFDGLNSFLLDFDFKPMLE